jgi:hypothetical protein
MFGSKKYATFFPSFPTNRIFLRCIQETGDSCAVSREQNNAAEGCKNHEHGHAEY